MNSAPQKVVLYGLGMNFKIFIEYADLSDIEIVALVDGSKYGSYWKKWLTRRPSDLKEIDFDEIYLLIRDNDQIIQELTRKMHIERSRIKCTYDLNLKYIMNENLDKYQYVMFTDTSDFLNYPYNDLNNRSDFVSKITMSQKEKWLFDGQSSSRNLTFIFRDYCYSKFKECDFIEYIRKKYPKSKLVLLMSDMIEGEHGRLKLYGDSYTRDIKTEFDLVITYHSKDALKYGFVHYCQTYPYHPSYGTPAYDVLFVGKAKDRLETLHKIFIHLKSRGVSCRFWISETADNGQLDDPDIIYNRTLSYSDYLKEVAKCRCILEICQRGDESTYRYAEAVINNKKLIVNDLSCKSRKYFSDKFMQCINLPQDIDCAWLLQKDIVDYKYENDFAPENLLRFLGEQLKK